MTALVRIRSERDRMSAIERRIADYILENAQLLRDYSSQQLANALGISQSSVVKFCQKLGFKGYPDLKLSINEAVVRADSAPAAAGDAQAAEAPALRYGLWARKSEAEEATRLINPADVLDAVARALGTAGTVYAFGAGDDALPARGFAQQLGLLGLRALDEADPAHMAGRLGAATPGDVLLLFSEHGIQPALGQLQRQFRARGGGPIVTVTRHSANPLRAHADHALLVSAHDDRPYVAPLLYRAALQHLLDRLYIRLCEADAARRDRLQDALERIASLHAT
ncbi:MAG: MurR/RpiR family transcriptional regulator [Xanthomonadales bacterium]|nr:MurR/RpiR family transcriptional regulator [Xanthomonadales bacterium]